MGLLQQIFIITIIINKQQQSTLNFNSHQNRVVIAHNQILLMMKYRKTKLFFGGLALILGYDYLTPQKIILRNLNTVRCGLKILYDYKIRFNSQNCMQIHEEVAKDIYQTCMFNDGLYIKFGQGMAASDHVLPPPFFKHLSKLQDKAKSVSYEKIKKVFEEDEGKTIGECFKYFESEPIASASIAQVHRATLHDGTKVAVKIQKPNIKKQFSSDMFMHLMVLHVLEKAFDLPLVHFSEPIERNLEKQVDFKIEAHNSQIAKQNFEKTNRTDIYIPKVYDEFTRDRVLVTEWIQGIKVTKDEQLNKLGFKKKDIIEGIITAFAEQIFVTGFVHCDPHPGNIFVRPNPKHPSKHQIVIIDHGLCIPVRNQFRLQYASFWKSLFINDQKSLKEICKQWGLQFNESFATSQLLKPYDPSKHASSKPTAEDVMKSQLKMKQQIKTMLSSSGQFPEELIFIGRNMNIIRSLNKHFNSNVDRVSLMAETAARGLGVDNAENVKALTFKSFMEVIKFRLSITFIKLYNWYLGFFGTSVDQKFDQAMLKKQEDMFAEYGFKSMDTIYDA